MRCDQCSKTISGKPVRTSTRTLCTPCGESFLGAAAGYIAGGTVGDAISTAGWFRTLRDRRRAKDR